MSAIYVEESRCRKCYGCIRVCPVKATKVEDGQMRVVDDICVACGECMETCGQGARRGGDVIARVEETLAEGEAVALLDPSFPAAFPAVAAEQVVAGLAALGFSKVMDTSFATMRVVEAYLESISSGAGRETLNRAARTASAGNAEGTAGVSPFVSWHAQPQAVSRWIQDVNPIHEPVAYPGPSGLSWGSGSPFAVGEAMSSLASPSGPSDRLPVGPIISSSCPAVVRLIERHYPDLVGNLVPVASPPVVAARLIRGTLRVGPRREGFTGARGGPHAFGPSDREEAPASGASGSHGRTVSRARVVHVGPCFARKVEAAELGAESGIDAVLTFEELAAIFEAKDLVLRSLAPRPLDGPVVPSARYAVFAGGMSWLMGISKGLSDERLVIAAGASRCVEVMGDLVRGVLTPSFVDASMCRGCLDAPALRRRSSISARKHLCRAFASRQEALQSPGTSRSPEAVDAGPVEGQAAWDASGTPGGTATAAADRGAADGDVPATSGPGSVAGGGLAADEGSGGGGREGPAIPVHEIGRAFKPGGIRLPIPSEAEIAEILAFVGRLSPQEHLDCGMCGYQTCRAFAIAVYQNMARSDMCLQHLVERLRDRVQNMKAELVSVRTSSFDDIYGTSHQIGVAKDLAARAARSGSTALLLGESGVGKEVFARAIHAASSRQGRPFVSVNCAAIPDNLMESELFGYVDGAFTGAARGGKPGKFELASGGTIFLDEIGDMSLQLQSKLLRVLQTHKIERVGGTREIDVDVRVMAATNRDLEAMVDQGEFRLDLYYRLNVVTIRIPPLRERLEDIPLIISRSLAKLSARCPTRVTSVSPEALRVLLDYSWPGNVRELENVLERALNLADGEVIDVEHLPERVVSAGKSPRRVGAQMAGEALDDVVARAEQEALLEALKATNNNRSRAAKKLGISRSAFYEKLRRYNIVQV